MRTYVQIPKYSDTHVKKLSLTVSMSSIEMRVGGHPWGSLASKTGQNCVLWIQ